MKNKPTLKDMNIPHVPRVKVSLNEDGFLRPSQMVINPPETILEYKNKLDYLKSYQCNLVQFVNSSEAKKLGRREVGFCHAEISTMEREIKKINQIINL